MLNLHKLTFNGGRIMRKLGIFILGATFSLSCLYKNTYNVTVCADQKYVYVGGMVAGFTLK